MDRFLIRKVKLDASTVPANIQEEETSEKGNGEEKSARENPEGEPVSEAGTSTEQQDKLTNVEQMKTRKQEQVNVFQKLPSVKGANRKLVRCSVCYRNIETAKIYAPKGKVPDLCQELGVVSRARILDNHLQSKVHVECLKADILRVLSPPELAVTAPMDNALTIANKNELRYVGKLMHTIYNDAKRGTLSAYSCPSRHAAYKISEKFQMDSFRPFSPNEIDLRYINPVYYNELLTSIVDSYKPIMHAEIDEALAVSLRFDGSIDRMQLDNEHVMAHIVEKNGNDKLIFLGFSEPPERGARGSLMAIQAAVNQTLDWDTVFGKVSSLASDGENKNTGVKNGLWSKLDEMRKESSTELPLLKLWCACHRSNLAWISVTKSVPEVQKAIRKASAVSTFFHQHGTRWRELRKVAEKNDLRAMRLPCFFEVRWTQYTAQLFHNLISSWCALMTYFNKSTEPQEQGFFETLRDFDFLRLICFMVDVTSLFSRFQKKLQSNKVMVFDIGEALERFISRLQQLNDGKTLIGGFEEHLVANVSKEDGKKILHGYILREKIRRSNIHNFNVSERRSYNAIRNEVLLSINTFLRQRFGDKDFADLAAIKNLPSAKEEDLRKLHAAIVPDQTLADFAQSCLEVGQMTELNNSDPRLLLKAIIGDKSMKSLHVALARIIAAKPQSADVERLISTYNKIKTDGRSSISPETLCKYMFIAINMPDLASFDFRSPAMLWLEKKRRRLNHATEKAGKQDWFKGVFEGAGMQEESPEEDCSKTFKRVSFK